MKHQGKSRVAMFAATKEESAVGMERFLTKTAAHFQGNRDWTVKQWLSTDWHSQKQACVDKLHYMLYGRSFNPQ